MEGWREQAACAESKLDFYALHEEDQPHGAKGDAVLAELRLVCGRCPVARQCATEAVERSEPYGVWAGSVPTRRAALMAHHEDPVEAILAELEVEYRRARFGGRQTSFEVA